MDVETSVKTIELIVKEIAPTIIHGLYSYVQFNSLVSALCFLKTDIEFLITMLRFPLNIRYFLLASEFDTFSLKRPSVS